MIGKEVFDFVCLININRGHVGLETFKCLWQFVFIAMIEHFFVDWGAGENADNLFLMVEGVTVELKKSNKISPEVGGQWYL